MKTLNSKQGLNLVARAAMCLAFAGCLTTAESADAQLPRVRRNIPRVTPNNQLKPINTNQINRAGIVGRIPARAIQGSDLIVQDFKRTAAPQFKNGNWEIPVSFKVKNQGNASTGNMFVNGILYGSNYRYSGFMNTLPAGASKTTTGIVKIPDNGKLLAGRTLNLVAYADAPIAGADTSMPAYGRVDESNDNNNQATLSVKLPVGFGLTGASNNLPSFPGTKQPQRVPEANFTPNLRPAQPPIGFPQAELVPGLPQPQPPVLTIGKPDLVIKAMPFVPNQPQKVYVTVQNVGKAPAGRSTLQLTIRKIMTIPVSRQTEVRVPALNPGESKVITVDASKILPTGMPLQHTTFRADADAYKLVAESDETNNRAWHKP